MEVRSADAVGQELRALAKRPAHIHHASTLNTLAADIDTPNAGLWAKVDLFGLCIEDDIEVEPEWPIAKHLSQLDLVRNVLLFLPIFITWVGVFLAVRAYRSLLGAPIEEQSQFADVSFLQLWAEGFGGRTWATFDLIAALDAFAILIVIVVSAVGGWVRRRSEEEDEAKRRESMSELRSVLTEATLVLASAGYDSPDRFSENLKELVPVYKDTLKQLVEVQHELSESLGQGSKNVAEITKATGDLAHASQVVKSSAEGLERHIKTIGAEVATLEAKISSLVGGAGNLSTQMQPVRQELDSLVKKLGQLNDDQGRIAADWAAMADNPRAASKAAADTAKAAADTAKAAGDSAKALSEAAGALPQQMRKVGDALVEAVDRELAERQHAAAALTGAAQVARELEQSAANMTTELHRSAEQAAQEVGASSHAAARELIQAIETLRESPKLVLPDLQQAAVTLAASLEESRRLVAQLNATAMAIDAFNSSATVTGNGGRSRWRPWRKAPDRVAS